METCGGLTRCSRSARGRPCVRSSRSVCATGTAASCCAHTPLLFLQLPKSRFDFVSFKTKKTLGRAHFAFPTSNGHRGVLLAPQQHIHCAKRGPKQTLHSLRQLRLGFELQPPPLSDTTLAERLPLRVPVIHDYAQRSTTESSTHTDVVMVVVLRSRDAVCLRLASLA